MKLRVTGIAGLAVGEALRFPFEREGEIREGFVLRLAEGPEGLVAYHNRCPHWGVDLDMGEGRFYSPLTERIFCCSHGALFVPATGYCDAGPCAGSSLEKFALEAGDDPDVLEVEIADEDPDPRW